MARAGARQEDGVTVLDDSRAPAELYLKGDYTLFMEMVNAATIPQLQSRWCSQKAKGWPIDQTVARITAGRPYFQIMGFEAGEARRCAKDTEHGNKKPGRTGVYPLADSWGWTRQICEEYIHSQTGVWWPKSACTYCVYALQNEAGRDRVLAGFAAAPELAWEALVMEHIAEAANPTQTLISGSSLHALMTATPGLEEALRLFGDRIEAMDWSLIRVRRAMDASATDPAKRGATGRALTVHATGDRAAMRAALARTAARIGKHVDTCDPRHPRVWVHQRAEAYPAIEELWTIVPAYVATKIGRGFDRLWDKITATPLFETAAAAAASTEAA